MRSTNAFSLMGGPAASLLMGSVCIVVTLLAPQHAWQKYWMLFAMMANFSIAGFFVNLIPLKPESQYSDGAQLYQVVTNGPWAHVDSAFAMVSASAVSPLRARDFDANILKKAADSVPTGERGLMLRLFACNHYLDIGKIPEALANLAAAEALWDQSKFERPQDVLVEFVFVNAFYKEDSVAEEWWRRLEGLPKVEKDADYWRARTALLLLQGHRDKALEAWSQGDAIAEKLPAVGAYESTRSNFARLKKALDEPKESLQALARLGERGADTRLHPSQVPIAQMSDDCQL